MPASTFAKEYFGYWVVTMDPLLTSAKWVAYGTEVQVGNILKTYDFLPQGLCPGIARSIVLFGDLCQPRVDILCGPRWSSVSLHPVGGSVKTDSPPGVRRGTGCFFSLGLPLKVQKR